MTLSEFMTFFGILIEMTMVDLKGGSYPDRWNQKGHKYTNRMPLGCFKDIRSALQTSDIFSGGEKQTPPKDLLFKVRPLVNVLKKLLVCTWSLVQS